MRLHVAAALETHFRPARGCFGERVDPFSGEPLPRTYEERLERIRKRAREAARAAVAEVRPALMEALAEHREKDPGPVAGD